jgi:cytidine deaminase
MFYDPKRKIIVEFGTSRPCGINHNRHSVHAEQKAIQYCLNNDKRKRYKIYISRYNRHGEHKCTMCCSSCTKLAKKYNFTDRIFTVEDDKIISAISEFPEVSLAYKIKYDML